jgi:hypothetical protein
MLASLRSETTQSPGAFLPRVILYARDVEQIADFVRQRKESRPKRKPAQELLGPVA